MKATDFADFFEFHIEIIPMEDYIEILEDDNNEAFCYADTDETVYAVIDDQFCFRTRYINYVETLGDCFDSMLHDYIDNFIEEDGFEYNETKKGTYYEQALEWIKDNDEYKGTRFPDIIACLVNPELIENDVEA